MADGFDVSQLNKLAVDLGRGNAALVVEARAILAKASVNIKADMAKELKGHKHFKRAAYDVRYTIKGLSSEVYVETGRGEGHQGGVAWVAAFGTATQPPSWDHTAALHREAPAFEKFLAAAAAESIL